MVSTQMLLLFIAAILGGTLNSVAGGGSFFTFPSLLFTGVLPIPASATNTVALWPGSLASTGAYRRELAEQKPRLLFLLILTSLMGGVLGAIVLLKTPQSLFVRLIPYLLLTATLLFTFSPSITTWLRIHPISKGSPSWRVLLGVSFAQLVIALYGGYFGGGIGILMLATLALMGMENIHAMNAVKNLLAVCINGIAVITFVLAGIVVWSQAILMIVGAVLGGYGGAYIGRKIDQKWVRLFVMLVGFSLTTYFFLHPR